MRNQTVVWTIALTSTMTKVNTWLWLTRSLMNRLIALKRWTIIKKPSCRVVLILCAVLR